MPLLIWEVATAYLVGGATAYLRGCHCLSGGSHSDNKASLGSSETGTELGNFKNNIPHHKSLLITGIWLQLI